MGEEEFTLLFDAYGDDVIEAQVMLGDMAAGEAEVVVRLELGLPDAIELLRDLANAISDARSS